MTQEHTTPSGPLRFTHVCHLGTRTEKDQRVARDQHGNWYLYDWSGPSPEHTDDGPLRINLAKPFLVTSRGVLVTVTQSGRNYSCGVTYAGLIRLVVAMAEHGETAIPLVTLDSDERPLNAFAVLADAALHGGRVRADVALQYAQASDDAAYVAWCFSKDAEEPLRHVLRVPKSRSAGYIQSLFNDSNDAEESS